jgi:uncharacterized protein YecE (DUF72 family)
VTTELLAGTSGFSFAEWKGSFYPADLPAKKMLAYFSSQLPAVEINNTFYRMPKREVLAAWVEQVPAHFRFAAKAPQRITHFKRLKEVAEDTRYLYEQLDGLGDRLGVVLFQLPPNFKLDLERLHAFLPLVAESPVPVAFEFRHETWNTEEVRAALADAGCALCASDTDEAAATIASGMPFGYLRLRRTEYDDDALRAWAARVRAQSWQRAFVFFKHEDEGRGPRLARRFLELWPGA